MKPLVSILIPAYNAEKWIAETIESAVAQTWERKEIIIVDDGTTGRTLEVARETAIPKGHGRKIRRRGAATARATYRLPL